MWCTYGKNYLEEDIVNMYLTFFVREGQVYKRFDEEHCERAYDEKDLEKILGEIGFKLEKKIDCYSDMPVSEKTERITYVLRK